ncbi:coenzyme F420-0:L-glutamate ligase [Streptomyces sp. NPDC001404]|uniref:coenzyme F420-0:L-glutamate ligase n=1 Tax=Streptomyces sp. NPDC001404 TaxID=3364571 RepID=UPI0036CF457E
MTPTTGFRAFSLEPFPDIKEGASITDAITGVLADQNTSLEHGDVLVIASKAVSVSEGRYVALDSVTPGEEALDLSARTGKPAEVVQLILDESTDHFLATERGPIIARHRLGYQLTSAGVDRAGTDGAWLLPADPDASARRLRDELTTATGVEVAVVIADSDGRADRRGSTVIAIGAAGISPLRVSEHPEDDGSIKRQQETLVDLAAAAAGIILGQRGRGAPVVVLRGMSYEAADAGVSSILHRRP